MTPPSTTTVAEREYRHTATTPEIEVAEVVRLAHMPTFRMAIEHRDGEFSVRLTDLAAGKFIEGQGPTFEAAWRSLPGAYIDGTYGERIAARGQRTGHLTVVEPQR